MVGRRMAALQTERSHLIDRLMSRNGAERAKILVRIMDLEDVIEKAAKDEKSSVRKKNTSLKKNTVLNKNNTFN